MSLPTHNDIRIGLFRYVCNDLSVSHVIARRADGTCAPARRNNLLIWVPGETPVNVKSDSYSDTLLGSLYALLAFSAWGFLPLYWKALLGTSPLLVVCHRILWSFVIFTVLLTHKNRWPEIKKEIRSSKEMLIVLFSAILISGNWLIYIWAVQAGYVLETSLGYYINPLVNVALGFIFLNERLNRNQWVAVALAACGVLNLALTYGQVPWIALSLALSFSTYGLLRKIGHMHAMSALFMETVILLIPCLFYTFYISDTSGLSLDNLPLLLLLMGTGLATALPLTWFGNAAKRLNLSTLGVFQYIAPTFQFLLAVWVFKEPFTQTHLITFIFIWVAVVVYSAGGIKQHIILRTLKSKHAMLPAEAKHCKK